MPIKGSKMKPEEYKAIFNPEIQSFCEEKGIHFYPWIGSNYNQCEKKIFIIGESYYLDDWNPEGRFDWDITKDACALAIRKYLGEYCDGKVYTKEFITFDKASRVLLNITGRKVAVSERRSLWHNVGYTVFIQNSFRKKVADSSSFDPEEIKKDTIILNAILDKYKPDLVIVYSNSIQRLIASNPQRIIFHANDKKRTLTSYIWNRKDITFWGIPHPSILRCNIAIQNLHEIYRSLNQN